MLKRLINGVLAATAIACLGTVSIVAGPDVAGAASPKVVVRTNITYGHDRGEALTMDEYLTPTSRPGGVPAVVVLHGGGFEGGNRHSTAPEARAIAKSGMDAFNISYRLVTPTSPGYPDEVNEAQAAVAWIRANAGGLGVNAQDIGAFGVSAGGYLVIELGVLDGRASRSRVSAVVAWSAPTNLSALAATAVQTCTPVTSCPRGSLQGLWYWAITDYLGCDLTSCAQKLAAASPVSHVHRAGAALMLWNSTDELVPITQETDLAQRAKDVGEPVSFHVVSGDTHGTQYGEFSMEQSIAFLAARLAR